MHDDLTHQPAAPGEPTPAAGGMSFRRKLLWACSPLLLAMVIVATLATVALLRLGELPGAILSANFRTVDAVHRMRDALDRIDHATETESLGGAPLRGGERREAAVGFERALAVQVGNITEPGEERVTDELARAWRSYRRTLERPHGSAAARHRELANDRVALQSRLGDILRMNSAAMHRRADEATHEAASAVTTMLGVTLAAIVLALAISAGWLRRLLLPLRIVERGVRRIAAGDFDARLNVEGDDEVAGLARSFNEMADTIAAYRSSSLGELLRARNRLEAVMDSLPDALVLYDLEGSPLLVNRVAASLLPGGWSGRAAELPRPLHDAVTASQQAVRADREPHVPSSVDAAVELPGGQEGRWWLVAAHPVDGVAGNLDGISVALRDVSRARRAADFRGDLVAAAAHELRTPLTSLHMAIALCLEQVPGPLNARQLELLETGRQDCARLESLIDELLELARLEAGAVRLDVEAREAAELVTEAAARFEARAGQAGLSVEVVLPGRSLHVRVDAERARSVFDNLLENAVGHAGEGGRVELGVAETDGEVRFWVRDHGPGIPGELRDHVFEKFVRVPGTPKRGSGLGLSIVRDVVHAHGGRCGVEPAEGDGARFWFTLPRPSVGH